MYSLVHASAGFSRWLGQDALEQVQRSLRHAAVALAGGRKLFCGDAMTSLVSIRP